MRNTMIIPIHHLKKHKLGKYIYQFVKHILPDPLKNSILFNNTVHTHNIININNPHMNNRITNVASYSLMHISPVFWYNIPDKIVIHI